jgi:POT family proton-dependent oligopeptide transporter
LLFLHLFLGGKVSTTFRPLKFGLGLSLLGLGFGFWLMGVWADVDSVIRVCFWLITAYLFHTLGELCISVGLSYVSKLVPAWIGIMFGVYYLFIGMGNKLAGSMGGMIETITAQYSLTTFF